MPLLPGGTLRSGRRDSFLKRDRRLGQETSDIIAEFVGVLRCALSVILVHTQGSILTARDGSRPEVEIDCSYGIAAVARFFRDHWKESGLPHHLHEITTGDDRFAFISRDEVEGAALTRACAIIARLV